MTPEEWTEADLKRPEQADEMIRKYAKALELARRNAVALESIAATLERLVTHLEGKGPR
jgi:hypothetical protein